MESDIAGTLRTQLTTVLLRRMRSVRYALIPVIVVIGVVAISLELWWTVAAMLLALVSVGLSLRVDSQR